MTKRIKTVKRFKPMVENQFSDFWLDRQRGVFDGNTKLDRLMKLAANRRAISNFVRILTKQNIPVKFNKRGGSYTDGKSVVIAADLRENNFDPNVGLALHEASHIVLTDFDALKDFHNQLQFRYPGIKSDVIHSIVNWLEDRRIDRWVYSEAPGYRGYYTSMYDKYFHSNDIDKALVLDEYTDPTWESYMFRFINMMNPNSRVEALPRFKEIVDLVDLRHVNRWKNTADVFETAIKIYQIIDEVVKANPPQESEGNGEGEGESESKEKLTLGSGGSSGSSTDDASEMTQKEFDEALDELLNELKNSGGNEDDDEDDFNDELDGGLPSASNQSTTESAETDVDNEAGGETAEADKEGEKSESPKLSDAQKRRLETAMQKQKDFIDGKMRKTALSTKDHESIDAVDDAKTELKEIPFEQKSYCGEFTTTVKKNVLVVGRMTEEVMKSDWFPFRGSYWDANLRNVNGDAVTNGFRKGRMLANKLKLHDDIRITEFNRKRSGRLDRNLLHELGFDSESVFYTTHTEAYPNSHIHISIDGSGSMSGTAFSKALQTAVTIAKAVDEIATIECVISIRGTYSDRARYGSGSGKAIVVIAYDSRVDKFSKIRRLFPYLAANGTTPEGLTFAAIQGIIPDGNYRQETYFVNMSDGMPWFENYSGNSAIEHTRKEVVKMNQRGIKVLSYFISNHGHHNEDFTRMYGKNSETIDVNSITQIATTMNKRFLEKN